jgi:hypothetical protein
VAAVKAQITLDLEVDIQLTNGVDQYVRRRMQLAVWAHVVSRCTENAVKSLGFTSYMAKRSNIPCVRVSRRFHYSRVSVQ